MNPSREEALFALALEKPADKRPAFLDAMCEGDPALRQRLEALLAAHDAKDSFLEPQAPKPGSQPASTVKIGVTDNPADDAVGRMVGHYKLLEKLGEGGCGAVYVAEQTEPVRRRVALKVIKLGMDTKAVVARFEAERQALAMMDHPNIAKVLDAGTTEAGRPYFIMELVRGIRITEYCDQNQLSTRERLDLFIKVCHAIQHAHQKGIIHRDIKPSNIMVTLHDGVPVPKVIDFGIAKATEGRLTDATVYTQLHQFVGTPAYISPEQAEMSGLDIDTRSDIYSLGVLLYELLIGSTPFDANELMASGIDGMRKMIREKEPVRPSTRLLTLKGDELTTTAKRRASDAPKLVHQLKGDLDWIVMKCLEKDRTRRYETANGLASDLKRHLNNEPVLARPPSAAYKFQKAFRRNKLAFSAAGAVTVALVLGLGLSTWMFFKEREAHRRAVAAEGIALDKTGLAEAERQRAIEAVETARQNLYVSDMNVAKLAWDAGDLGRATELLNRHRPARGQPDNRGFEWRYLWSLCRPAQRATLAGHAGPVNGIALSPDGKTLATAGSDKTVKLWDVALQREAATLAGHLEAVNCVAFSPDGKTVASGSQDNTVILWDIASRTKRGMLEGHSMTIQSVAFSPDGKTLVSASNDRSAKLWNVETLKEKNTLLAHSNNLLSASFSPDGKTVATGSRDRTVKLWDMASGRETRTLDAHRMFVWSVAFSPDGKTLALGLDDGTVGVWDLTTYRELPSLTGHRSVATSVQFSPDGQTLASGSLDNTIRLWSARTWSEKAVLRGHLASISAVAFTPDNRTVVSSSYDRTVKFWDADRPQIVSTVQAHALSCLLDLSPDGKTIASSSAGIIKLWDVETLAELATLQGHTNSGTPNFSTDGTMLACASTDHTIKIWDVASRNELATLTGHSNIVSGVRFLADRRTLLSCSYDKTIKFWDLASFRQINSLGVGSAVYHLALSADGNFFAAGCADGTVTIFEASSRVKKFTLRAHDMPARALAFSPNGKFLATGSWDGTLKLWNLETRAAVVLRAPVVNIMAFSPDGKTLVTGSADKFIRFWNLATQQEVLALQAHLTGVTSVRFSRRGDLLVTSGVDGKIKLWPGPTLEEIDAAESNQSVEAGKVPEKQGEHP